MSGAASQAGDADSSRAPGLTSGLQGSMNVYRAALLLVPQWQCISSFVFYISVCTQRFSLIDNHEAQYCNDYFREGIISRKCWQDLSCGGNFHNTYFSLIVIWVLIFCLGEIFSKTCQYREKQENYPQAKIYKFSVSHYLISVAEGLALPDQYDNFAVFNNDSVRIRSLHPEVIKLEAIVHYCC